MDEFGKEFIRDAGHKPRVLAVAQTQTKVETVGNASKLRRLGNSCLFDDRKDVPPDAWARAQDVARAFAPYPLLWTELKPELMPADDDAES